MKEIDILKELEKLDDDIEPGFLSELKQQTPDELHSRIMNSIRMEAMNNNSIEELGMGIGTSDHENGNNVIAFKPRFRFNYKKYATVASAAVILAVVFIGGAKELLNQSVTSESISPTTNISDNTNNTTFTKDSTNSNETAKNKETSAAKAADKAIADAKVDKASVKTGDVNKQNTGVADNSAGKKSIPAVDADAGAGATSKSFTASDKALATATAPNNSKTAKTGNTEKVAMGTAKNEDDITIVTSKKAQTIKGIVAPTTAATADDKNTDKVAANDGNTKVANNTTESNLKDYGDTEDATNTTPNTITNDMKLASLENIVNYELNLNTNQSDIIQFVEDKGTPLYEGIYKLKYTDYVELVKLLVKNNILPKTVNELETNAQLVTIKIIKN